MVNTKAIIILLLATVINSIVAATNAYWNFVTLQVNKNLVNIVSELPGSDIRSRYTVSTASAPFFRMQSLGNSKFSLRAGLQKLVEYNDSGSSDSVTPESSPNVVNFNAADWSPISPGRARIDNETTLYKFTSVIKQGTVPRHRNLTVRLDIYITTKQTSINSLQGTPHVLKPNSIKFSITISNFNFTLKSSKLGLAIGFFSNATKLMSEDLKSLRFGNFGSFVWDSTFTSSNGSQYNVVPDTKIRFAKAEGDDLNSNFDSVFFKFDHSQPSSIYWDPEVALLDAFVNDVFPVVNRTRSVGNFGGDHTFDNSTDNGNSTTEDDSAASTTKPLHFHLLIWLPVICILSMLNL